MKAASALVVIATVLVVYFGTGTANSGTQTLQGRHASIEALTK